MKLESRTEHVRRKPNRMELHDANARTPLGYGFDGYLGRSVQVRLGDSATVFVGDDSVPNGRRILFWFLRRAHDSTVENVQNVFRDALIGRRSEEFLGVVHRERFDFFIERLDESFVLGHHIVLVHGAERKIEEFPTRIVFGRRNTERRVHGWGLPNHSLSLVRGRQRNASRAGAFGHAKVDVVDGNFVETEDVRHDAGVAFYTYTWRSIFRRMSARRKTKRKRGRRWIRSKTRRRIRERGRLSNPSENIR